MEDYPIYTPLDSSASWNEQKPMLYQNHHHHHHHSESSYYALGSTPFSNIYGHPFGNNFGYERSIMERIETCVPPHAYSLAPPLNMTPTQQISLAAPSTPSKRYELKSITPMREMRVRKTRGSPVMREERPPSYDYENIDTRDVVQRVARQLRDFNISQTAFAEKILGRSQGTLSDLLKNPKPWDQMKAGKETFRRMLKWLNMSEDERLQIFQSSDDDEGVKAKKRRVEDGNKRQRFFFDDVQKRTLETFFLANQKPTAEVRKVLADKLNLDIKTVDNFFMNKRRRGKLTGEYED